MGLTHLSTAACFTQSSSLPEHACFLSGKCPVLLYQLLFSWGKKKRKKKVGAGSNVLFLQSYDFLSNDFLHLVASLHSELLHFWLHENLCST